MYAANFGPWPAFGLWIFLGNPVGRSKCRSRVGVWAGDFLRKYSSAQQISIKIHLCATNFGPGSTFGLWIFLGNSIVRGTFQSPVGVRAVDNHRKSSCTEQISTEIQLYVANVPGSAFGLWISLEIQLYTANFDPRSAFGLWIFKRNQIVRSKLISIEIQVYAANFGPGSASGQWIFFGNPVVRSKSIFLPFFPFSEILVVRSKSI